jgi:Family of unknown function (DUF6111)
MEARFAMLIKSIGLVALILATTSSATLADFSGVSCNSPKFIAYMSAHIGHGKFINGGRQNPKGMLYGPVSGATTISNNGKSIACEVTIGVGGRGGSHVIHGRFTATGRDWQWLPAY